MDFGCGLWWSCDGYLAMAWLAAAGPPSWLVGTDKHRGLGIEHGRGRNSSGRYWPGIHPGWLLRSLVCGGAVLGVVTAGALVWLLRQSITEA